MISSTFLSRLFHLYRDESIGRWGETGVPRENHPTHPQVLLAGVSGGFPVVLSFRPTYRLARLVMSEIILKGTLN